jgi:hypothetical protein
VSDKAITSNLTGKYPEFPSDYLEVFSYEAEDDNPIKICEDSIEVVNKESDKVRMRRVEVGDICNVDNIYLRVETYGLTNISNQCRPECSEKNLNCS